MTTLRITLRVVLPDLPPVRCAAPPLRTLVPLAAPVLLAAVDAGGMGLPARLLLHAAVNAAQQAAAGTSQPATSPA